MFQSSRDKNLSLTSKAAPGESLIEMQNLSFRSGEKEILTNINLELKAGDFLTVIGPNGAGKSTLIKIMTGILKPTAGELRFRKNFRKSYVPQTFSIPRVLPISVQGFLKLSPQISDSLIEETFDFMGIQSLRNSFMQNLSGGEIQKVLFARALATNPDVIFLDEPAQNLDVKGQLQLYDLIRDTHEKYKTTIVLISHELHFVMACSKHVVCLYKHICCSGSPMNIREDANFQSIFGKEMKELMGVYSHHHNHSH